MTIGVPAAGDLKFFGDTAMEKAYADALSTLAGLGHRLIEIPFADFYKVADLLYEGAWVAERYAAVKDFFDTHEKSFHPVTRKIYCGARTLSAADAFNGIYALQAFKKRLAPVIASIDLFCVPTAPRHYTLAELEAEPIRENSRLGTYTNFVNLLDMCGIAVPTGRRADGLPASVTLLAASGKDGLAATLARDLHAASGVPLGTTSWLQPTTIENSPLKIADELIDLVVVGAHLSGMPLNHQLVELGGIFSGAARTRADYRLHALAGTVPPKPGMVKVRQGKGVEIEVEIWRLTPSAFGRFVAAIPSPLGIGTIELSDGTSAKGFLCEQIAIETGGTDISEYRGWRAYCLAISQSSP